MSNDIDPQQFEQLCSDMTEMKDDMSDVKLALKGSREYSQKGALQRIDENEERSWTNKHKIDRAWYYVLGAGFAIGGIIKGIDWIL